MAVQVASLKAVIDADTRGLQAGLKQSSNQLAGFGSSLKGAIGIMGGIGAGVAIFSGVGAAIGEMVGAARESIAVTKQLEQVIKSTNGAAGVTVGMAKEWADSLSMVTNFQDDAIASGQALLLKYEKIGSDVFPRVTEAMLDYAQVTGVDIPAAAKALGPAFNEPGKHLAKLEKLGVSFTAEQKRMISEMTAVNNIAGAQNIILDALGKTFGGQARAMADPFIQMQNAIGEINETLGMGLMPMLLAAAKEVLPALQNAAKNLSPSLGELGIALGKNFGANLAEIIGMAVDLANQFGGMFEGINKLGAALGLGGEAADRFNIALLPLKITFGLLGAVFGVVGATLESLAAIIRVVSTGWGLLTSKIDSALGISAAIMPVWNALAAAGTTLSQIIQIIGFAWQNLIRAMSQPFTPPPLLTPGSPTPMELGLRGLSSAIKSMPPLDFGVSGGMGGMTPMASGGGNVTNNTYLQIGSQSFGPFSGAGGQDDALQALVQYLRQQLDR